MKTYIPKNKTFSFSPKQQKDTIITNYKDYIKYTNNGDCINIYEENYWSS